MTYQICLVDIDKIKKAFTKKQKAFKHIQKYYLVIGNYAIRIKIKLIFFLF